MNISFFSKCFLFKYYYSSCDTRNVFLQSIFNKLTFNSNSSFRGLNSVCVDVLTLCPCWWVSTPSPLKWEKKYFSLTEKNHATFAKTFSVHLQTADSLMPGMLSTGICRTPSLKQVSPG